MASQTNVSGSNPGPNSAVLPDTVQLPVGNIWKWGLFTLTLGPTSVSNASTKEFTFAATGIGLLTTDFVSVSASRADLGVGIAIASARVSATDTLAINLANVTAATVTPATNGTYQVLVVRLQPNWAAPATGNQMDW